jgi:hypothetical protein
MRRIADHPINRIEELLPWKLAAAIPARGQVAEHTQSPSNGNSVHNLAIVDTIGE